MTEPKAEASAILRGRDGNATTIQPKNLPRDYRPPAFRVGLDPSGSLPNPE